MAEEDGEAGPKRQNDRKPWTPERPFQRLNSPSFDEQGEALKGNSHDRGTRRTTDAPFTVDVQGKPANILLNRFFELGARMTPNWVKTVGPLSNAPDAEHAAEHEVFGKLLRSFQTWTDVPGFQWHKWYDWNLHVQPEAAFDWLRGEGNRVELAPPKKDPTDPDLSQFCEGSLECEWDCGSIGALPGPMFTDLNRGLKSDWGWPMTHDWVWVVGRSIYDGGHEFKAPSGQLLGRSELHPIKAMATVRVEAIAFQGDTLAVPVTQFTFFASVLGGYSDFDTLAPVDGKDYEFVVDLPRRPNEFVAPPHNIGQTPDFPFNRLALRRPEPRVEVRFEPYQNAFGALALAQLRKDFQPKITFITPDLTRPDEVQAIIKIPLSDLAARNPGVKSYGVQVNLGWPDPNQTQAKKVKKVSVNFTKLHPVTGVELTRGEWRAKLAVNRRWFHMEQGGIIDESGFTIPRRGAPPIVLPPTDFKLLPPSIDFFLPEDQHVEVHAHVWELNLMDDIYLKPAPGRTVMFNRVQLFAEAVRTGEDPSTVLPNDDLSDVGTFAAAVPLIVLEAIESIPVVGTVIQFVELLLSAIPGVKISPTRLLGLIGERPAVWKDHIDKQPPRTNAMFVVQRVVMRNALLMMADSFSDENLPLAVLDAGLGFDDENKNNPLPVSKDGRTAVKLSAVALKDDSDLAELFEFKRTATAAAFPRNLIRYEVEYTVDVGPQIPPSS